MSKKSGLGFVTGAVVGAAVGTVVGILIAPRSGAESRAMAADVANDMWDSAVDTYDKTSKVATEKMTSIRPIMDITTDELRAKVDAARERIDQLRGTLSDTVAVASVQAKDAFSHISDQVSATVSGFASKNDNCPVEVSFDDAPAGATVQSATADAAAVATTSAPAVDAN